MPGEVIDTAFVEIRPLIAPTFQRDVATGIRKGTVQAGREGGTFAGGAFGKDFIKGFAGITAATIGIEKLAESLHEGVTNAGLLQKQGEALDITFGKDSGAVKRFAETAHEMGLSQLASEQLSVRIGLLSHNLGIGQDQASEMTIEIQKLGLAIAEIRGLEPGSVLSRLPLVLAGNLRAIKELGFSFTPFQIKQEAVARGFLRQGQAITPTARALAIYSLLVKQLPYYEQQAAKHSGDLTNKQHRLAASTDDLQAKAGKLAVGPLSFLVDRLLQVEGVATGAATGLDKVSNAGDKADAHSKNWFQRFIGGHQAFDFITQGPLDLANFFGNNLKDMDRQISDFLGKTRPPVKIGVQLVSVNPNDPLSKILFGGPLTNPLAGPGFNTGQGPTPPRVFGPGFQMLEAPSSAPLRSQLTAQQNAVFTRLEDEVELARASGNTGRLKAALRDLRKAYENLASNTQESLAIRRTARVNIAQINEQIRQIDQQIVDDAKQAAAAAKAAREQRQDALIDQMTSAAEFRLQIASTGDHVTKAQLAAEQNLINVLKRELAILQKAHRDGTAIRQRIRQEQFNLRQLKQQQAEERASAEEDRLQDLLSIAQTTKSTADDRRRLLALERFYQSKVNSLDRQSVARRKYLVKLRQTQQQLRELKDEESKTTALGRQDAFAFLQAQTGFFSNLASNLLGTATAGLVGGTSTPAAPSFPTPPPRPLPSTDALKAQAARERDARDPSAGQLNELIRLTRVSTAALQRLAGAQPHKAARDSNALLSAGVGVT